MQVFTKNIMFMFLMILTVSFFWGCTKQAGQEGEKSSPPPPPSASIDAAGNPTGTNNNNDNENNNDEGGPNCGDNKIDGEEECDDGNKINRDACKNNCKKNVCGDRVLNEGAEECDREYNCDSECKICYGFLYVSTKEGISNVLYSCTNSLGKNASPHNSPFKVTNNSDPKIQYLNPTFSPNSEKIAFERKVVGGHGIVYGPLKKVLAKAPTDELPEGFNVYYYKTSQKSYAAVFPQFSDEKGDTLTYFVSDLDDEKNFHAIYRENLVNPIGAEPLFKYPPDGVTFQKPILFSGSPYFHKMFLPIKDTGIEYDGSVDNNTYNIFYWNLSSPEEKPHFIHGQEQVNYTQVALSPDQTKLAFVKNVGELWSEIQICSLSSFHGDYSCAQVNKLSARPTTQNACWTYDGKYLIATQAPFVSDGNQLTDPVWDLQIISMDQLDKPNLAKKLDASQPKVDETMVSCQPSILSEGIFSKAIDKANKKAF